VIMAWRDTEGRLKFVFIGDGRVEDEKGRRCEEMGNDHEKVGLREYRMQLNVLFPMWQVQLLILRVITLI